MDERSLTALPWPLKLGLLATLALQFAVHEITPAPQARAIDLASPPGDAALAATSMGEPLGLAKVLMLYLQAFDNQPGVSIPFRDLDYARVEQWLARIMALDPQSQYPLLSASRLYAEVPNEAKQRCMLEFVYRAFLQDPNRRWPWLAHGVVLAKHRLKDLPLAASYAAALRQHATGKDVPNWVQQMDIFLREDMNELESAKVLLGGLLQSGKINDPHEWHFLNEKLKELEARNRK